MILHGSHTESTLTSWLQEPAFFTTVFRKQTCPTCSSICFQLPQRCREAAKQLCLELRRGALRPMPVDFRPEGPLEVLFGDRPWQSSPRGRTSRSHWLPISGISGMVHHDVWPGERHTPLLFLSETQKYRTCAAQRPPRTSVERITLWDDMHVRGK